MRTNCLFYWIEPYPVDIAIQRFSSLHCKRFCAVSEQRTRNKSHSLRTADTFPVVASNPRRERSDDQKCVCCSQAARAKEHTKNGASKRAGRGWGRKEGNACRQTAHLACHAWVRTSTFDAVINCHTLYIWPIKCLTFHRGEVNFWGKLWKQNKISQLVKLFRKQCVDGRNGESSMNPNYQCGLCNCSFKVSFVKTCQTSYISTENLFSPSKRKEFNSEVLAQNIWGGKMRQVFKSRIFDLWGRSKVKAQLDRMAIVLAMAGIKAVIDMSGILTNQDFHIHLVDVNNVKNNSNLVGIAFPPSSRVCALVTHPKFPFLSLSNAYHAG